MAIAAFFILPYREAFIGPYFLITSSNHGWPKGATLGTTCDCCAALSSSPTVSELESETTHSAESHRRWIRRGLDFVTRFPSRPSSPQASLTASDSCPCSYLPGLAHSLATSRQRVWTALAVSMPPRQGRSRIRRCCKRLSFGPGVDLRSVRGLGLGI